MKTAKKVNYQLFIIIIIILPFFSNAQEQAGFRKGAYWKAVNLDQKNNAGKNGVEIYKQKNECGAQKVTFIKVVNTNDYAIKINYQLSADGSSTSFIIPAMGSIEGACSATDPKLSKLVIHTPDSSIEKEENESQRMIEYMYDHLVITKVQ